MRLFVLIMLFLLLWGVCDAVAEPSAVSIRLISAPGSVVPISKTVPRDGLLPLELIVEGVATAKQFGIHVSHFLGPSEKTVTLIPMQDGVPVTQIRVDPQSPLVSLTLDATAIAPDGAYTGEILFTDDSGIVKQLVLSLKRDMPVFRVPQPSEEGRYLIHVTDAGKVRLSVSLGELGETASPEEQKITLLVTEFLDDEGRAASVGIGDVKRYIKGQMQRTDVGVSACGDTEQAVASTTGAACYEISLPARAIDVILDVSGMKAGKSYQGSLRLLDLSVPAPIDLPLNLVRGATVPNASLLAEVQPETKNPVCKWGSCQPLPSYINLRETSGEQAIRGLSVSWKKPQDVEILAFDPNDIQVLLLRDGEADADKSIAIWPPSAAETERLKQVAIAPYGTARLKVVWPELPPGDHKVVLKLNAEMLDQANLSELSLSTAIRRPWQYPALVLLAAILLSYFATKGVQNHRQALAMMERIDKLRDLPWLRHNRSHLPPIVHVTAVLSRARTAIKSELGWIFLFKSVAVLAEVRKSLDQLDKIMPYLERLSRQWSYWEQKKTGPVRRRARYQLQWIAGRLGELQLGDEVGEEIRTRLKEIEEWRDPQKLRDKFWSNLQLTMRQLREAVSLEQFDQNETALAALKVSVSALAVQKSAVTALGENMEALKRLGREVDVKDAAAKQLEQLLTIWEGRDHKPLQVLQDALTDITNRWMEYEKKGVCSLEMALITVKELLDQDDFFRDALWREILPPLKKIVPTDQTQLQRLEALVNALEQACGECEKLANQVNCALEETNHLKASHREVVRSLLLGMDPDNPPATLNEAVFKERKYYSPLKLIMDQSDTELRAKLIAKYHNGEALQELYDTADKWVWDELKNYRAFFRLPIAVQKQEAYQLIRFEVGPGEHVDLSNVALSFAFNHRFVYCWEFKSVGDYVPLKPVTQQPYVTQFIPHKDVDVEASVTIYFDEKSANSDKANSDQVSGCGDCLRAGNLKFHTYESAALSRLRGLRYNDLLLLAITLVSAFVIGIESNEFAAALKGSSMSYLLLFGWGVAAEQVKNALANLGASKG
ncbi:MAG: hypothetical protein P8171_13970 [Candidatus Thiodiazotropha sp.]